MSFVELFVMNWHLAWKSSEKLLANVRDDKHSINFGNVKVNSNLCLFDFAGNREKVQAEDKGWG